jgi:DNA-binding NarL/FixJ family response regulator
LLYKAAWEEGAAMSAHEAIGDALRHGSGRARPHPLTAREHEVALLLAQGLGNRAISARLVISEGTAKRHVENILAKLGLRSRAQVADWLTRQRRSSEASRDVPR